MPEAIGHVAAAIDYIEDHLQEALNLETIARGVHCSKYHLHRLFTGTTGLTLQTYVHRRRMTEAAARLVFSRQPVLGIALTAGYESQQAFSDAFKAMYKKSPRRYREEGRFYPLQLRLALKEELMSPAKAQDWKTRMTRAAQEDIAAWMQLVHLVIDGYPCYEEERYLDALRAHMAGGHAWMLREADTMIGAMALDGRTGRMEFLGVHPQCRRRGIARAFCEKALQEAGRPDGVSVTTFRAGDRADTGYRRAFERIGFSEAELLVEFGYPTQRMTWGKAHPEGMLHG